MGKPQQTKTLNQASMRRLLEAHGWVKETGGKHETKMVKPDHRPVTLPHHRGQDYAVGLMRRILKQAGLDGPDRGER